LLDEALGLVLEFGDGVSVPPVCVVAVLVEVAAAGIEAAAYQFVSEFAGKVGTLHVRVRQFVTTDSTEGAIGEIFRHLRWVEDGSLHDSGWEHDLIAYEGD